MTPKRSRRPRRSDPWQPRRSGGPSFYALPVDQSSQRGHDRALRVVAAAALLCVLVVPLLCCASWWQQSPDFVWSPLRDSRQYPHTDDPFHITKGNGDLERDLLPHFQVKLPCDTADLRYGEWEDFGPAGRLYLRFTTSPDCLAAFRQDNRLTLSADQSVNFPTNIPEQYGWTIEATNTLYVGEPSDRVHLYVSVDSRSTRPTVFVVAEYF